MVFQFWYTPIAFSYLFMISAVAVVFKTMGLQSVPKPASCFFCSRQDSLKWCSTSLSPTVILKRAVKSPSTTGKWCPSSITYLLSVIHTLKSSLWLMNLWFMMYPLTDSSAWCSIFWNPVWVFSLLLPHILFLKNGILFRFFHFLTVTCVTMQTKVCPN